MLAEASQEKNMLEEKSPRKQQIDFILHKGSGMLKERVITRF